MRNACIDIDHGGGPRVFRTEVRTARKHHMCCECGETIEPGRKYEYVRGLWEDDWNEYKTCARCANIRSDFFNSYIYGHCVEHFQEVHGFDYRDGIPKDFAPCQKPFPTSTIPVV